MLNVLLFWLPVIGSMAAMFALFAGILAVALMSEDQAKDAGIELQKGVESYWEYYTPFSFCYIYMAYNEDNLQEKQ